MAHLLADVVSLACMLHTFCYCPDKAICSAMCRDIWPLPSLVLFVVVCFVFSMLLHLNSFLKRPGTKFPLEVDACLQLRPSVNTGTVQNALKCISSICSFFFFIIRERDKSNLGKIQESDILFSKCLFCSLLCTTTTTPVYFKDINIEIHMPRCNSIVILIEKIAI